MAKKILKKKKEISVKEGNQYDKIFKENAESIFLPLIERTLNIRIKSFKPLTAKLQTTLEREMDFFYEIETDTDYQFLLHIEFQTESEPNMVYRNAEYHGIALNLKKMDIRHVVIYLGTSEPNMLTELPEEQVYRGFDLVNVHALDHAVLLQSQIPDVVILAILANYPMDKAESVLRLILRQLKAVCQNPNELSKYINQLVVLSRLRKIEGLTIKITQDMPITYDIESDYLYKVGTEKGIERGIEKEKIEVICNARRKGASIEFIADIVNVSVERVRQILALHKIE